MTLALSRIGRIAVVAAALALSGCVGNGLLDDLDQAQPTGSDFSKELFKDYSYLARSFGYAGDSAGTAFDSSSGSDDSDTSMDVGDLVNAYAQKALDSAQGQEVLRDGGVIGRGHGAPRVGKRVQSCHQMPGDFRPAQIRAQTRRR